MGGGGREGAEEGGGERGKGGEVREEESRHWFLEGK